MRWRTGPDAPSRASTNRSGKLSRAAAMAWLAIVACHDDRPPAPSERAAEEAAVFAFADATESAGIAFRHRHYGTGERYMPESMGFGAGWLDYDGDGWSDLVLVDGDATPGWNGAVRGSALYRNLGDGRFEDVSAAASLPRGGYGMGLTAGDVDGDGDIDLYLTRFGPNALLRNNGDGTYSEVTKEAMVGDPQWSTSAAFADVDGDGDLDLYVANYVAFTYAEHKVCGDLRLGFAAYCHPDVYAGVPDSLYLNRGDGTFERAGAERLPKGDREWRETGKGLGVLVLDADDDGDPDLYVANDSTPNFLWVNDGTGRFEDLAPMRGLAFNGDGRSEAGMGVASGDVDGDGDADLMVTNLDLETNTLYAAEPSDFYVDRTFESGLGPPSWLKVGFGVSLADLDNDGWLDVAVSNGHIIDNIHLQRDDMTHAQANQLFRNLGGLRFAEAPVTGTPFTRPAVGRGLATADYDRDGDLDLVFSNNDGPTVLARNDTTAPGGWLRVRLRGRADGLGARVEVTSAGRRLVAERRSASSYLSQDEGVLHFGLGGSAPSRLEVRWPSGLRQRWLDPGSRRELVLAERP